MICYEYASWENLINEEVYSTASEKMIIMTKRDVID